MKRIDFIKSLALIPFIPYVLKDNSPEWSAWKNFDVKYSGDVTATGKYRLKGEILEISLTAHSTKPHPTGYTFTLPQSVII